MPIAATTGAPQDDAPVIERSARRLAGRIPGLGCLFTSRSTRGNSQRGFSLLEVMIALVIAGLGLAMVFRATTESNRATSAAARYQEAISRAHSHLDGTSAYLAAGEQEGDDGAGFHWRTLVRATDTTGKRDTTGQQVESTDTLVVTLAAVTVWVSWRDGGNARTVRLDTERLMTAVPVGKQ